MEKREQNIDVNQLATPRLATVHPLAARRKPLSIKSLDAAVAKHRKLALGNSVRPKPKKLFDEKGLYVLLTPAGSACWRLKYRFAGRERVLPLGMYPEVGLAEAREARDEARSLIRQAIDPSVERRRQRQAATLSAASTFRAVAEDWIETESNGWAELTKQHIQARLRRYAFPHLGAMPVSDITTPEVRHMLKKTSESSLDTAHRVRGYVRSILQFAIDNGLLSINVAANVRLAQHKKKHRPAITTPKELSGLMRSIRSFRGSPQIQVALQLAPYLFVRPGELRRMEWAEIDLTAKTWVIPGSKMKSRRDHLVPLSDQVISLIEMMRGVTGHHQYVFSGLRNWRKPISDNSLNAALRSVGYDGTVHVVHGFRATARTLLDEELDFPRHLIEHQLAHVVKDPNGNAYDRTTHLPKRAYMMQRWADYLDDLAANPPE